MPRRKRYYFAIRGEGAFILNGTTDFSRKHWEPLTLLDAQGPVLLFNAPELQRRIAQRLPAIDVVQQYRDKSGEAKFTDLLDGGAIATVHAPVQLIDNGAIAFIAEQAGAIVTDFAGNPIGNFRQSPTRELPNLLVAASAEVHRALVGLCS